MDLPKHPYIKTRMHEHVPIHKREKWSGGYLAGPVAGSFKAGAFEVEVCDRTCKQMVSSTRVVCVRNSSQYPSGSF